MSLPSRLLSIACRTGWVVSSTAAAVSICVLYRGVNGLPNVNSGLAGGRAQHKPRTVVAVVGHEWTAFVSGTRRTPRGDVGSLSRRYRLVGTLVAYSSRLTDDRKAVIDDRARGSQKVVTEGESFDGITVARILRDRVVLRHGGGEETLFVKFEGEGAGMADTGASGVATQGAGAALGPEGGAEENRFGGRQVGENRWVFDRGPILRYYSELMDNPERLVKVFDSFKPVYGTDRRVSGYRLQVEGEPEFFQAVGLREGDVVRNVNTMRMTSRRRAEFFIREFIDNRVNNFTLDVERGGQTVSQTYESNP